MKRGLQYHRSSLTLLAFQWWHVSRWVSYASCSCRKLHIPTPCYDDQSPLWGLGPSNLLSLWLLRTKRRTVLWIVAHLSKNFTNSLPIGSSILSELPFDDPSISLPKTWGRPILSTTITLYTVYIYQDDSTASSMCIEPGCGTSPTQLPFVSCGPFFPSSFGCTCSKFSVVTHPPRRPSSMKTLQVKTSHLRHYILASFKKQARWCTRPAALRPQDQVAWIKSKGDEGESLETWSCLNSGKAQTLNEVFVSLRSLARSGDSRSIGFMYLQMHIYIYIQATGCNAQPCNDVLQLHIELLFFLNQSIFLHNLQQAGSCSTVVKGAFVTHSSQPLPSWQWEASAKTSPHTQSWRFSSKTLRCAARQTSFKVAQVAFWIIW